MSLTLTRDEIASVTAIWAAQKRELIASFAGSSMRPTIEPGQRVVVRFGASANGGDVILYRWRDQVVVHRIDMVGRDWVLPWGDANAFPDEPISHSSIDAVIVSAERNGEMVALPSRRRSLTRRVVRFLVAPSPASAVVSIARRVRFIYRIRNAVRRVLRLDSSAAA